VFVPYRARSHELETLRQLGPVAPRAVERRAESTRPVLGVEHPLSKLKGWAMANVLAVTTRKLGHPVDYLVVVVASDQAMHGSSVATSSDGVICSVGGRNPTVAQFIVFRRWRDPLAFRVSPRPKILET
jgi:hypothetical protein